MLFEDLTREHIREPAESADRDRFLFELIEVFDIRRNDEAMPECLGRDVNHLASEICRRPWHRTRSDWW